MALRAVPAISSTPPWTVVICVLTFVPVRTWLPLPDITRLSGPSAPPLWIWPLKVVEPPVEASVRTAVAPCRC